VRIQIQVTPSDNGRWGGGSGKLRLTSSKAPESGLAQQISSLPFGGNVVVFLDFGFMPPDLAVQFVSQFIDCGVQISM
jgi:hypothetical protein